MVPKSEGLLTSLKSYDAVKASAVSNLFVNTQEPKLASSSVVPSVLRDFTLIAASVSKLSSSATV